MRVEVELFKQEKITIYPRIIWQCSDWQNGQILTDSTFQWR